MLAAAGIVVTEISTPTSAPDLADVSDSTPAIAGEEGDDERERVGLEMNWVNGWLGPLKSAVEQPGRLRRSR